MADHRCPMVKTVPYSRDLGGRGTHDGYRCASNSRFAGIATRTPVGRPVRDNAGINPRQRKRARSPGGRRTKGSQARSDLDVVTFVRIACLRPANQIESNAPTLSTSFGPAPLRTEPARSLRPRSRDPAEALLQRKPHTASDSLLECGYPCGAFSTSACLERRNGCLRDPTENETGGGSCAMPVSPPSRACSARPSWSRRRAGSSSKSKEVWNGHTTQVQEATQVATLDHQLRGVRSRFLAACRTALRRLYRRLHGRRPRSSWMLALVKRGSSDGSSAGRRAPTPGTRDANAQHLAIIARASSSMAPVSGLLQAFEADGRRRYVIQLALSVDGRDVSNAELVAALRFQLAAAMRTPSASPCSASRSTSTDHSAPDRRLDRRAAVPTARGQQRHDPDRSPFPG